MAKQKSPREKKKTERKRKINSGMLLDSMIDLSEFRAENEDSIFRIKVDGKDSYISIMAVSGIDIFHYTDSDMESVFCNFARATNAMKLPHKYIFTSSSPYFEQHKEYLKYKINKTGHRYTRTMLSKKYDELCNFEKNHKDRLAYLMVFSENIEELRDCCKRFIHQMSDTDVSLCSQSQAVEFLNKYLCFNTEGHKLTTYTDTNDIVLPDQIQFFQNHFTIGDKYVTSLVVSDYPANFSDLQLAALVSDFCDCIITLDVMNRPKQTVLDELRQSLKELRSRSVIKQDVADDIDTQNEFNKLTAIYNDISNGNEQMLYTTLRFYVSESDYDALCKRVREITEGLENLGMTAFVPINVLKSEYIGMVRAHNSIQTPFPLQDTYKRQYPFYYQSHTDPSGMFFGYTDTNGLNVFNCFYRNGKLSRNSYDMIEVGVKGAGKSVTMKSMLQDQILIGNRVMVLDVESEYRDMTKMFDGQNIRMSRSSTLNPLQIRKTVLAEAENDSDDDSTHIDKTEAIQINYTTELSRICSFIKLYDTSLTDKELSCLRDILVEVYKQKGITDTTDISALRPEQFPVFSDLYACIIERQQKPMSEYERGIYKKLETQIKQLTRQGAFGTMFDNYTNVDIDDSRLIVFDVKQLSELDANVYNAQLFNILSLMWAEICKNREHNDNIINQYDRRYVVCLIDEAHRFISTQNQHVTKFIEKLLRRSRKYEAGLWFASQSILDFLPSSDSAETDVIKTIFQLVQYKVILKQSPDSIEKLHEVFSQFTMSELKNSANFEAGEMLMSLSAGRNKLHCYKLAADRDLMYIGNAQDRSEIVHKIFNQYYHERTQKEYGKQLENDLVLRENFVNVFTKEVLSVFGLLREDSEHLTAIVENTVAKLGQELIELAKE